MNSYHLKLDLYPSPPSPQPDQPPARSTTTAALTSSKTPPSKAQQQGHGPAQELTARFQTLFKPFPQQTHHQQQLPPQSTPSITSSSSAQKRNNKQEASTGSTISHPQDDYRFGHISVSSLDQSTSATPTVVKEKSGSISATTATANNNSNNKGRSTKNKKMTPSTTAGAATTATVISDARSTGFKDSEPAQGILRLYRDTNEITTGQITTTTKQEASATTTTTSYSAALSAGTTGASAQPVLATAADAGTHEHGTQIIQPDQGTSVCVLAVPSYLSPGDFLNFVGPVRSNVSHFRIIRDSVPNRFMVLMKFRTKEATAEFYKRYNGKAFSSLETITTKSSNTTAAGAGLSATTDGVSEDQNVCAICGTTENLWICLICGHIGCGRYQEKHAYHHYYETSHLYALELESQRVWDYAGDGYVHRLIQNKTDGKLVELPSAVDGTLPSQHSVQVGQEKLDAIGLEYTYLLTSQLESQRLYFDAQMAAMTAQLAQLGKEAKDWEQEAALMNQKNRELAILAESLEKEKLPMLVKEKKAAEKRMEKMQERLQALERQYEEEKEMNVGLMTNQESIRTKLQEKEAEILELQDQVRDMMIYLDTQQKIESSSLKDELANGTVGVVVQPPQTSSPSGNHSRRKGRK
ncbi:hypothetical protein BGZ91_003823 [Linnemannia elongata]|nr:hypothetical protein BGZ91_003823 [Linnemannia elongata]